jgi:hypothetical protein
MGNQPDRFDCLSTIDFYPGHPPTSNSSLVIVVVITFYFRRKYEIFKLFILNIKKKFRLFFFAFSKCNDRCILDQDML